MKRLLTLGVILISSFSIGSEDECCKQITVGDHLYHYVGWDDTSQSQYNCDSSCVYSTDGNPGKLFCFKKEFVTGEKPQEKSVCHDDYLVEGPVAIQWFYGMNIVHKSVSPGSKVTFQWDSGHNVNDMTESEFTACDVTGKNHAPESGSYTWTAPSQTGNYYFACGVPGHCSEGNMKAKIVVCDDCVKVADDYQQLYSGVAALHTKMVSLLTEVQIGNLSQAVPGLCDPACFIPYYCWDGACVCAGCEDDQNLAPGNLLNYLDSVEEMTNVLSFHQVKGFVDWSGCSPTLESCVSNCLAQVLKALVNCLFFSNKWWQELQEWEECVKIYLGAGSTCLSCICELIKHYFPKYTCHDEPKLISSDCDRDCATFEPLTCVFTFTLEMLTTDADGRRADGRNRTVLAYNGKIPGPPIVICEGDELVLNFKNRITGTMTKTDGSTSTSTLHFHGIGEKSRPWSDGVPFVTQYPVISGEDFIYGFNSVVDGAPPGTYWYHSHVGSQRTNGAYGALIIKDGGTDPKDRFDVDNATNTLVLQEWYESSIKQIPVSILINGHGRIGEEKNKVVDGDDESEVTLNYLKGKGGRFQCAPNADHIPDNYTTNYEEFDVEANKRYRFRVIGAISQNFPLRLSIDEHKFTAIAMDSLNIESVHDLTDLWLAAGERYDIVVQTKAYNRPGLAYKIRVFGYTNQYDKSAGSLCTIAWMKYPGQTIDNNYVTPCNCSGFVELPSPRNTLNPVPNSIEEWNGSPANGNYFIKDLKATDQEPNINFWNRITHYIEFRGDIAFNGLRMTYPAVPFLLQDPANMGSRCTTTTPTGSECQHVLNEPFRPGYMTEIVLINNHNQTAAHPIHKHGGWYWVVGEGKYDDNVTVNLKFIKDQDGISPLPRNFVKPPAKDTIQVPQKGYVIVRTKLDNAGTWIFHCHINFHVTIGMAMVLQIGEFGKPAWEGQDWCTGHLTKNKNDVCPTKPPSPNGGPEDIYWHLGMENEYYYRCVKPGENVTFVWEYGHSVNWLKPENWNDCHWNTTTRQVNGDPIDEKRGNGPYVFSNMTTGYYHMACGVGGGHYHCKHGMKALIHVSPHCHHP
eukprot:GFUD01040419.1.p1 GENE.GFUD01040419.1~~GFUD01040419.1.p1  ORF type:complete len:1080 (-),score=178.77 GFUD01040419.1:196-3435(-)